MKRTLVILSVTACSFAFSAAESLAQGRAPGAGRGLSSAARGIAPAGPAIAGASAAASQGAAPAGSAAGGMSRSASGLERSGSAMDRALPMQANRAVSGGRAMNPERIAQHRADQANHLRSLSERNGNERLLQTADRMDASAQANYQRQTSQIPHTADEGRHTADETRFSKATSAGTRAVTAGGTASAKRGFWFRSR